MEAPETELSNLGVIDSELNIKDKITHVGFTSVFFVQCLEAIGCRSLKLSDG